MRSRELLVILTQAYGGMLASIWISRGAEIRRRYARPITVSVNLVALVLSDPQAAWITFVRGRYQQASRVGSGEGCQIVATGF